ncbi:MAG: patatin [Sulfurospirillum sp.]|nr:MAG: patatin [Sulfurospirillum sp.]
MRKKTVSLVLGSGGARGYAHIGVIDVLEKAGYEIRSISGSSMGALVGGLYAAGKLNDYREWVLSLDMLSVLKLVDFSFATTGFIKGDKVFDVLETIVGKNIKIEDLPIDYTAVATDIDTQKEVWFQEGDLLNAIRASIAIPTIFTPIRSEKHLLVDGGILNPLPTVPLLSDTNDMLIAVNLNGERKADKIVKQESETEGGIQQKITEFIQKNFFEEKREEEINYFTIVSKTIETMQNLITRYELAAHQPDIVINIPKNLCGFYEFHEAEMIIDYGRKVAKEAISEYQKLEKLPENN